MTSQNSITNTVQDNDFSVNRRDIGTAVESSVAHSDNTSGTSNAKLLSQVGGTSGGDPHVNFNIPATQDYAFGIDNTDSDNLKITDGADPSSGNTYVTFDQATTNVWFDGISFDAGTTVLDVYEEDTTFTPVLAFGGGTTGITYGTQEGDYARIGSIIFFRIDIVLTNKGSSTGTADISGLPGTLIAGPPPACYVDAAVVTFGSSGTDIACNLDTGPVVEFSGIGTTINREGLDDTDFANTSEVRISGWYESST